MKRKCAIKETPELEIQLKDKTYNILFSNSLLIEYEDRFGNLADAFNKANSGVGTCEFFARLMYCYFSFIGEDITLGECKVLVVRGSDGLISAMSECLMESILLSDNEEVKKNMKMMNKQLQNLLKK